jgi:hypothetical protein
MFANRHEMPLTVCELAHGIDARFTFLTPDHKAADIAIQHGLVRSQSFNQF